MGRPPGQPERLAELIAAGADVLRLNFSHAEPERQAQTIDSIRGAAEQVGREVAILGDLPGPKLRIGSMRGDVVELDTGTTVTLTSDGGIGDERRIPVSWAGLPGALGPDELVYLADGAIRLRVLGAVPSGVECEVEVGGALELPQGDEPARGGDRAAGDRRG